MELIHWFLVILSILVYVCFCFSMTLPYKNRLIKKQREYISQLELDYKQLHNRVVDILIDKKYGEE